VGRVALKSIIFFEVVTTIGLILGAVAINLTQAGAGVTLPASIQAALPTTRPEGWQQILLNIFPENIAKAVTENQILQVASSRCFLVRRWPPCRKRNAPLWSPFCNR